MQGIIIHRLVNHFIPKNNCGWINRYNQTKIGQNTNYMNQPRHGHPTQIGSFTAKVERVKFLSGRQSDTKSFYKVHVFSSEGRATFTKGLHSLIASNKFLVEVQLHLPFTSTPTTPKTLPRKIVWAIKVACQTAGGAEARSEATSEAIAKYGRRSGFMGLQGTQG